jgi:hypothetical protein
MLPGWLVRDSTMRTRPKGSGSARFTGEDQVKWPIVL